MPFGGAEGEGPGEKQSHTVRLVTASDSRLKSTLLCGLCLQTDLGFSLGFITALAGDLVGLLLKFPGGSDPVVVMKMTSVMFGEHFLLRSQRPPLWPP